MKDFSSYIGIIGGGIAGLTAGCILKSHGINTIIFEKASQISEYGAGISISANGLKIFDAMGLTNSLTNSSFTPSETNFQYLDSILKRLDIESLVTSSRKEVLHVLFSEYSRLGGEILYAHEHVNIDINSCEITFSNNAKYKVSHILACDGIRSKVRDMHFPASGKPLYSGYSAWRGIGRSESKTIQFHFGPGAHIVTYPINKTGRSSFVGIIKNKEVYEDSWKLKGSKEAMLSDFQSFNTDIFNMIDSSEDIYKWGIFIRPPLKSMYVQNITLIGDAAHPMAPFLGQGACMAIEDAYTFATLAARLDCDFNKVQTLYQKIRSKRNNHVQATSMLQGKLNHIKNPLGIYMRNLILKYTPVVNMRTKKIWGYDAVREVKKALSRLS